MVQQGLAMDCVGISYERAPSPVGDGARGLHLARTPSGGNSCTTSISTCTYTSSVFSAEGDSYDSRIKEIEEYYIKTLLNEDETTQEDYSKHGCLANDTSKTSVSYYHSLNDFRPTEGTQQQQGNSVISHNTANTAFKSKNKKNSLEVEINPNLRPSDDLLPLTTENLQRLTIDEGSYTGSALRSGSQGVTQGYASIHKTTQPAEQPQLNKELYKTELCESFTTKGSCRYGNKCQFAHGFHELKFKPKSNNYRTKACVNWTRNGFCPYGKRCCFKHGNDEDIQPHVGQLNSSSSRKNLHANVKALQKITW